MSPEQVAAAEQQAQAAAQAAREKADAPSAKENDTLKAAAAQLALGNAKVPAERIGDALPSLDLSDVEVTDGVVNGHSTARPTSYVEPSSGRRTVGRGAMSTSRRSVLAAGAGGTLAAMLGAVTARSASAQDAPAERPNIVWFIADDPSPYLGAYGDDAARTPTIDGLAEQGIVFDAAYCAAPVCAPSRFALLTGVYPTSAGPAHHMGASAELPDDIKGFPEYLRDAGYYTSNNSKTDYNADVDLTATWDDSGPAAHWRNRPAGAPFFAQDPDPATLRLSFATADRARIEEGVARLAKAL